MRVSAEGLLIARSEPSVVPWRRTAKPPSSKAEAARRAIREPAPAPSISAEQERALAGLRTRAGTVLAAASIAGSLLGAEAGRRAVSLWSALGLISFLLCLGCAMWVLTAHELVFAFDGQTLLAESDRRQAADISDAYRTAGHWIERHVDFNREEIARLSDWLTVSGLLLTGEIVLWTLSIVD